MSIQNNTEFKTFIKDIKQKIYSAKNRAILSVNRLMIELYFDIGKEIVILTPRLNSHFELG